MSTPAKPKPRLKPEKKAESDKSPVIPPGLLHIIVSIDKQRATLFSDGHPVLSTAVSTGTPDHPTPMGVFSIIQKSRHHVSNLYGAPMPYMQRITWSGSALHQGQLPGYPASHGCVRLSESFANTLWKATKLGARVIITRPEVAPHEFDHPRLFVATPRVAEVPLPMPQPSAAADAVAALPPVRVAAPVVAAPQSVPAPAAVTTLEPATTAIAPPRIRTAEAGSGSVVAVVSVVGDAAKATVTSIETAPRDNASAPEQPTKLVEAPSTEDKSLPGTADTTAMDAKTAEPVAEAKPAEGLAEAKPVEFQPVESKPAPVVAAEVKVPETKPAEAAVSKAPETTLPTIAAPAPIIVDHRLQEPAITEDRWKKAPASIIQEAVYGRPISVFISLKEQKLYVRQGWKPLFDAPVTVERPGEPIGTHVYTAMNAKADGAGFRWTVVSIPSGYRRIAELKGNGKTRSDKPKTLDLDTPPSSPSVALDRIVLTPELVARVSELMTAGSSLIVSDNKLSDETGEYTDFIVTTR